jgi:hypothetical protein
MGNLETLFGSRNGRGTAKNPVYQGGNDASKSEGCQPKGNRKP